MSNDGVDPGAPSAPRCTPPMPPVANTRIPAANAAIIVADTVVAAQPPSARATASDGRAALRTDPAGAVASASRSVARQTHEQSPVAHGDGRRHRAPGPHGRLGRPRDLEVLRDTAGRG